MPELALCPHTPQTYVHAWHGLPTYDCAGSHLPFPHPDEIEDAS